MNEQISHATPVPAKADWPGLYPVVGKKIVKDFDRPKKEIIDVFKGFFLPDVAGRVGPMYTMSYTIRPGYMPIPTMVGPACTVKVQPGDNLMVKKAIYMAKPGDVIVIDARGHMDWCLGGGEMIMVAKSRGVAGIVADGAYRDLDQIEELAFPIFLKGVSPATGPKQGPGELNTTVSCGGVVVKPGDIIMGDREGVIVIPQEYAQRVIDEVRKVPEKTMDFILNEDKGRHSYFDELLNSYGFEIVDKA